RNSSLSAAIAASSAATDFSRPTNSGTMRCGKTTMSRSGRIGRERVMTEYMGCPPWPRNNGNRRAAARFSLETIQEAAVAQDRDRIDSGLNDRPLDETVAGTGPGIADDSLSPERTRYRRLRRTKKSRKWPISLVRLPPRRTH